MRFHIVNGFNSTFLMNEKALEKMLTNYIKESTHGSTIEFSIITLELDEQEDAKKLEYNLEGKKIEIEEEEE